MVAVVESPHQCRKFLEIKDRCPNLQHVIQIDDDRAPGVLDFEELTPFLSGNLGVPQDSVAEAIDRVMRPPWFPVNFRGTAAKKQFREVTEEPMWIDGFEIIPRVLHHPDGVAAYRIQCDGKSIVIATDFNIPRMSVNQSRMNFTS